MVDSQPMSPEPPVEAADGSLGRLDMGEWRATIDAVDERPAEAIDQGLFAIESEHTITVAVRVPQEVRLRILRAIP